MPRRDIEIDLGHMGGNNPQWACKHKRTFNTCSEAETAARVSRRRSHEVVNAYRCTHCRKWHIGHGKRNYRTPPPGGKAA